ncbi:MAG: methylthioribulose 1-phosphate dehydratase [Myxococcota bacterium]
MPPHPMKVMDFHDAAQKLCDTVQEFGQRQWCLATGGNFSARIDDARCLITQSGKDKSNLAPSDLMLCDLDGRPIDADLKPSAETALHVGLYRYESEIGSVLHTHSVTTTVMSRIVSDYIEFSGFEMQKALKGIRTHDAAVRLPVFENTQDMDALAALVQEELSRGAVQTPGFLVRGHGLYAWGSTIAEAKRHVEGIEFLLACAWQELLVGQSHGGMH